MGAIAQPPFRPLASVLAAVVVCLAGSDAAARAQVTDLEVVESGANVELAWASGVGPFRVFASGSPDFYFSNRIVQPEPAVSPVVDSGAAAENNSAGGLGAYYSVVVSAEADPSGFSVNPPPPAPPVITSLTPNSGPPGTLVAIAGTGFPTDGSLIGVSFHKAPATINSFTAIEIQAVVPIEAVSGDVRVCIASDVCSNALPFLVTFGPAFQDLSSIAFEAGTGSLWVADRGSVDKVFEIDATGAVTQRGAIGEAVLAHPSPASGSGRIYYSNSTDTPSNLGTIRYVSSATNTDSGFDQAGAAGDNVRCEGLAARDTQANTVYFLDGVNNKVRRIVQGAPVHDINFGNTDLLTFNRPAGARFDANDNLYVTSTDLIYRIDPGQVVTAVGSGFTQASGMDLFETGSGPILVVADEAAGEVWVVDPATGDRMRVATGLSAPVGVALATSPSGTGTIGTALYVAEPTRLVRLPNPFLEFVETQDQRVLLTKTVPDDTYPSRGQVENGKIRVRVRLSPLIAPAGKTAFFRLLDPPDRSGYITGATANDNFPTPPQGTLTEQAPFDVKGEAEAVLTVMGPGLEEISGNNFRVEASLEGGAAFRPLATSPLYTTWRRNYIEYDQMWKVGAWIRETTVAGSPTPTEIHVSDASIFAFEDAVHVLSGDTAETATGEVGVVTFVSPGENVIQVATLEGEPGRGLKHSYSGASIDDSPPYGFVAKASDGTTAATSLPFGETRSAFEDAFAEWRVLPNGSYVPHWPLLPPWQSGGAAYMLDRQRRFFNAISSGSPWAANAVHVVSADDAADSFGLTANVEELTWISETRIAASPVPVAQARARVVTHELAHQYEVNQANPPERHDSMDSWTGGTHCLMFSPATVADYGLGVVKFHSPDPTLNELMCIRTHADSIGASDLCIIH